MFFYDEDSNPIDVGRPIVIGSVFAIAPLLNRSGENPVGLFIEDDEAYHLEAVFSSYWLTDLENVVRRANDSHPSNKDSIEEQE